MRAKFLKCAVVLVAGWSSTAGAALTEAEFNAAIDRVADEYSPVVAQQGGTLIFERHWESNTDVAMATRTVNQKRWFIKLWGGTAKNKAMTVDSFTLILCHELGHHLGGYPFYAHDAFEWAAAEGQADYWATQACSKRLWEKDTDANQLFADVAGTGCEDLYRDEQQLNLCKRIYKAIEALAVYEGRRSTRKPSLKSPDKSVVKELFVSHPAPQCRIDTALSGLRCLLEFDFNRIPGRNNAHGQNTISAEKEARQSSCFAQGGIRIGSRPLCWFKEATLDNAPQQAFSGREVGTPTSRHGEQLLPWLID